MNHPRHYTSHPSGVECIDITRHYCFSIGNAIKYLWRAGLKQDADKTDRDKSEKPTESGFIVCFGWNSEEKHYFVKGMDYMEVIKRGRELYPDVSESDFADGIEKFWGNETFSKWCYLADLFPEEVLDEIKNIK